MKEEALDRTMWRARFGRGFGPVVDTIDDESRPRFVLLREENEITACTLQLAAAAMIVSMFHH